MPLHLNESLAGYEILLKMKDEPGADGSRHQKKKNIANYSSPHLRASQMCSLGRISI